MRLTVLGSGSRGNALLLHAGGAALLVDAGFSFRDLKRRCAAVNLDPATLAGLVLTHEHGDHARGAARAAATWGLPVAASAGTHDALDLPAGIPRVTLPSGRPTGLGLFTVTAWPTAHDAREPVMVVVADAAGHRAGIAYDVGSPTAALVHACRDLDALVLEANHDEVLLRGSAYPPVVRERIAGRGGHLSNAQAAALAAEVAHPGMALLVLAHVSERCNRPDLARAAVRAALRTSRFRGRLEVAEQGVPSPAWAVARRDAQLSLGLSRAG